MSNKTLDEACMALLVACDTGNLELVKTLLSVHLPIDHDVQGWNPLSVAASRGNDAVVEYLLEQGAYVEGAEQRPSLMCAAAGGHATSLSLLLAAGADPKRVSKDIPMPLAVASELGSLPAMAVLLEAVGDVDQISQHEETPLHRAAYKGGAEACGWLLDQGANIEARNVYQETPVHRAVIGADLAALTVLLERGANAHAQDVDGQTPAVCSLKQEMRTKTSQREIQALLNQH